MTGECGFEIRCSYWLGANSLAFVYRNAIDALFCYTIIAENSVAEVVDERKFLHEGVTRTLFHTVSLLPEFLQWIHGFLQPVLAVVKDIGKQAEDYSLATPVCDACDCGSFWIRF